MVRHWITLSYTFSQYTVGTFDISIPIHWVVRCFVSLYSARDGVISIIDSVAILLSGKLSFPRPIRPRLYSYVCTPNTLIATRAWCRAHCPLEPPSALKNNSPPSYLSAAYLMIPTRYPTTVTPRTSAWYMPPFLLYPSSTHARPRTHFDLMGRGRHHLSTQHLFIAFSFCQIVFDSLCDDRQLMLPPVQLHVRSAGVEYYLQSCRNYSSTFHFMLSDPPSAIISPS